MAYDTSIAYNDSIITEIFSLFKGQDAIGIYFSDHGEDVYESTPGYFGHAIPNNPVSMEIGKTIPFMVYVTPEFKNLHPDMTARISFTTDEEFNTTNIIYAIMDIMDIRFENNDDVDKYSLFRTQN